jgi:uncharacterized membrane protein YfcA
LPDPIAWVVLLATALAGSVIGGIAGFGAGVILLPVVAWTAGLRAAVPIMTVTMLVGNLSRLWWSRAEVDRAVAGRFLAGAVPATAIGAVFYAGTPSTALSLVIGLFLLAAVPIRRLLASPLVQVRLRHFPLIGGVFGFLSSLVVTTGPIVTPFFLAYGLRRGPYIATEAVCAFVMHGVRGVVLARYALLTWETIVIGLALGGTMFAGSWLGRRLLDRMSDRLFLRLVEVLLIVMGLRFLLFPR